MTATDPTMLLLIRHAPALHGGRLAGRTDVAADCSCETSIAALRQACSDAERYVVSPAMRCVQTAEALWPEAKLERDPRLMEQDFGAWEGQPNADIPDLGDLAPDVLSRYRPPQGESFCDVCQRVGPALQDIVAEGCGPVAILAHAGTVRAALGIAIGSIPAALSFQVAPLSLTRLLALPGGQFSVVYVNQKFA